MSHRPKRSLGQNFLRDADYAGRIVAALHLSPDDLLIEIGPGQGALTESLVKSGTSVVAIEFDRDLIEDLKQRFGTSGKFDLVNEDALRVDFSALVAEYGKSKAKLVANLPYNISTPILQRLIAHRQVFSEVVLMFQREVVDRITAKPGEGERGFLTVLVENAFVAERLFDVPPEAFYPRPRVWSSVVRLLPGTPLISDEESLRRLLSTGFGQKRKTLQNNLKGLIDNSQKVLAAAGIDPGRRAQTLSLGEWAALVDATHDQTATRSQQN